MIGWLRARARDRWTWWRHTWTFQVAHKPLCEHYAHDVLRLGRLRVCRSCTCLYTGLTLGVIVSALLPAGPLMIWGTALTLAALVLPLSFPRWYPRWSRGARDLLRGGSGVAIAGLLAPLWLGEPALGLSTLATIVAVYVWFSRVRREKKLRYCEGCSELNTAGVCSGYKHQAERIQAYEEATLARLNRAGFVPHIGTKRGRRKRA